MNLKKIADGLRLIADGLDASDRKVDMPQKPAVQKQDKPSKKAEPKPEPAAEPEVPVEDVIKAMQKVAKVCGRSTIDNILADFNVKKVSELKAGDYADVITLAENALEKVEE